METSWTNTFPEIERIVTRAMAKSASDRYATAEDMRNALAAFMSTSREALSAMQAEQTIYAQRAVIEAKTLHRQRRGRPGAGAALADIACEPRSCRRSDAAEGHGRQRRAAESATGGGIAIARHGAADCGRSNNRLAANQACRSGRAGRQAERPPLSSVAAGAAAPAAGRRSPEGRRSRHSGCAAPHDRVGDGGGSRRHRGSDRVDRQQPRRVPRFGRGRHRPDPRSQARSDRSVTLPVLPPNPALPVPVPAAAVAGGGPTGSNATAPETSARKVVRGPSDTGVSTSAKPPKPGQRSGRGRERRRKEAVRRERLAQPRPPLRDCPADGGRGNRSDS